MDQGAQVVIQGDLFSVGFVTVEFVSETTFQRYSPSSVTFVNDSTIITDWDANYVPSGQYDVVVTNVEGCSFVVSEGIYVHPKLLVFFVDPPVVYNGINIQVEFFLFLTLIPEIRLQFTLRACFLK